MNADFSPDMDVADAGVRGLRTLAQGLVVDVLAAAAFALTAAVAGGIEWTRAYWIALALVVGKSIVTALVSYVARFVIPPATPTTEGGEGS